MCSAKIDETLLLRRFCFIGQLDPVFIKYNKEINVEIYDQLKNLLTDIDDLTIIRILTDILQDSKLNRHDEALFVYASYLIADLHKTEWKTNARQVFPQLVFSSDDLMLFCKYALGIRKKLKLKGFSKTLIKAIQMWYIEKTPEAIRDIWVTHHGNYGITHKTIIKLCHVNDEMSSNNEFRIFFKKCTALIEENENSNSAAAVAARKNNATTKTKQSASSSNVATTSNTVINATNNSISPILAAVSKLRTTNNKNHALKIIKRFNLQYKQVPSHFLRHASIYQALIPTMSYMQLLKSWKQLIRYNHQNNRQITQLSKKVLQNKELLRRENIHPINFLLHIQSIGKNKTRKINDVKNSKNMSNNTTATTTKLPFLEQIYKMSFGENTSSRLRMHITINLQGLYQKKHLNIPTKLNYLEAAVAIAFGYFKKDNVDVFCWTAEYEKLDKINWTKNMNIGDALEYCKGLKIDKCKQRLITPIKDALINQKVFDLFLTIVPSAARGNPKNSSFAITEILDEYRKAINPNAKFQQ